jgi:hypothetical protein
MHETRGRVSNQENDMAWKFHAIIVCVSRAELDAAARRRRGQE